MSDKKRRVLITGVNGFIGRNLVHGLNPDEFEFIGVSAQRDCALSGVQYYEQADISDFPKMEVLFDKYRPDYVIHLAAIVHKKSFTADYDTFYKVNFLSSENIFRLCVRYGIKKVLFSSTVEVYDMKTGALLDESSATLPSGDYGRTKLMAEKALTDLAVASGVNYAIMRFAPVYGTDFTLNLDRRLYLVRGKLLYYFGSGSYFFNMCSVYNIVDFVKAFLLGSHPSDIYNISDTRNYTVKELVGMERQKAGKCGSSPIAIRLPYHLTYIAIAFVEGFFKILKKKSVFSVYNFKKIFKCIVYDNKRAADITGGFRWDMTATLYGEGRKDEAVI